MATSTSQTLDLFVLDGGKPDRAIVVARREADMAIAQLDLTDPAVNELIAFTERVEKVALGHPRPTTQELDDLGTALFEQIFRGTVSELYHRLPLGCFSIQIVTDSPIIHRIPWEYLRPKDRVPVPHAERCVVRVLPMIANASTKPRSLRRKLKVLFAVADPVDQPGVTFADVEASLRLAFDRQAGTMASLKIIPAVTSGALLAALNSERFDVFHFLGHGTVHKGEGRLILVDVVSKKSDFVTAAQLAQALAGQELKLCILSACLTGAGNFTDDFNQVATALLRAGVPAVVANQTSIPSKSVAPFVGALYTRLIRDGNIDSAVMAGRVALEDALRKGVEAGKAVVEWGIPTLYRLPGASQLFVTKDTRS